ncbi:MAG: glycoside hydrolase family 43 protein [Synergistaceae bacterium]|nr:glycoside hydrolase family 43 protein [Synergistaceae bacterium]
MAVISNPVLKGFNPDPSICRVGETYYIATSTFEWFPGVQVHKSSNLVNWELATQILTERKQLDMQGVPDSGGVWAPCLTYHDNLFWLVYSNVTCIRPNGWDVSNYLVTSPNIEGPWSGPIYLNSSGFDASLFHDDDGKKYLLYMDVDEHMKRHRFGGIGLREYLPGEQKLSDEEHVVYAGTPIKLTEAPHVYKENGYYYLLVAEGGTEYTHAASLARSRNILGPYETHPDNPILSSYSNPYNYLQKAGHASFVKTHWGGWYLAHLTGRPIADDTVSIYHHRGFCPLGRESALQKLEWRNDWPYVVNGPVPSTEVEAPPEVQDVRPVEPVRLRDNFEGDKLDVNWATLRASSFDGIYSLTERPGFLRLYGKESLASLRTKALVARRWQSLNFEAVTAVEFAPFNDKHQAGIACFYNSGNWSSLGITYIKGKGRVLNIVVSDGGPGCTDITMPIDGNEVVIDDSVKTVYLKVTVNGAEYRYGYSFDNQNWHAIGGAFDSRKLSDDYIVRKNPGFFTGAFVGLYCVDNFNRALSADFDFFDYNEQ